MNALKFQMAISTLAIPLKMAMKNEAIADTTLDRMKSELPPSRSRT